MSQKVLILKSRFSKMNSERLLRLVSSGKLLKRELTVAAAIIEKRFPTPVKRKVAA